MEEMLAFVEIRNQGSSHNKNGKLVAHNKYYELSLVRDENGDFDVKTRYGAISKNGKGGIIRSLKGAKSHSRRAAWLRLLAQLHKKMDKSGYKFVECETEEEWMEEDIARGYMPNRSQAHDNGLSEILSHRSF